jgi:hypothetical protein
MFGKLNNYVNPSNENVNLSSGDLSVLSEDESIFSLNENSKELLDDNLSEYNQDLNKDLFLFEEIVKSREASDKQHNHKLETIKELNENQENLIKCVGNLNTEFKEYFKFKKSSYIFIGTGVAVVTFAVGFIFFTSPSQEYQNDKLVRSLTRSITQSLTKTQVRESNTPYVTTDSY